MSLATAQIDVQQGSYSDDGSKKYSFKKEATTPQGHKVRIIANLYFYDHSIVTYTLVSLLSAGNLLEANH